MALDVQRAIVGFVDNGGVPGGTEAFYLRLDNPTEVAKSVIFITMTLAGDSFVVRRMLHHYSALPLLRMHVFQTYRLWIVWNRTWWIAVLPIMLLTATAGTHVR